MQTVSVTPADNGWVVRADGIQNAQVFRTGSAAEAAAMKLAQALSATGAFVEIRVFLKDGALAKRFAVPNSASAGTTPGWIIERHAQASETAMS